MRFNGVSLWRDAAIGTGVGGVNTVAVNGMYGEGKDVVEGALIGGGLSSFGYVTNTVVRDSLGRILPMRIGASPFNKKVPAILQNLGRKNPYPDMAGHWIGHGISNFGPILELPINVDTENE